MMISKAFLHSTLVTICGFIFAFLGNGEQWIGNFITVKLNIGSYFSYEFRICKVLLVTIFNFVSLIIIPKCRTDIWIQTSTFLIYIFYFEIVIFFFFFLGGGEGGGMTIPHFY